MDAQKTVILVEDNAGRLFAGIPGGNWYDVTLGKPATFAEDAQCIANDETDDWNLDIYDDQPEGEIAATWTDGKVTTTAVAKLAATKYVTNNKTIILVESGYDTGMTLAEYCEQAAQYGDDPRSYSSNVEDFDFASKNYARSDPAFDVPDNWPDDLPVWSYPAS